LPKKQILKHFLKQFFKKYLIRNFYPVCVLWREVMTPIGTTEQVAEIMRDFARLTGLEPAHDNPQRYLWTDAFAVCNYLELFQKTGDSAFREMALRLIDQVHHTLGRFRKDDHRTGWISGLPEQEGELHPTLGGLRIGKPLREREAAEPYDEQREWDQDGQYYHYLTKWMHALHQVSRATNEVKYLSWAIELAQTVHAGFTCSPRSGGRKRMYWKMSTDLTRPLVPSMGQHDPVDGFITYHELQRAAVQDFGQSPHPGLAAAITDMAEICQGMSLSTDDPLGTGGLLSDTVRIAQLAIKRGAPYDNLLESLLDSGLRGVDYFIRSGTLKLPASYRLPFRELGLSIGVSGAELLPGWINKNPALFGRSEVLQRQLDTLMGLKAVRNTIEQFWMNDANRQADTWTGHREINMVMLATSLAPRGFLIIS
jgi:hypothetical protein